MELYPEELDLVWLFEAEPELSAPDLPWHYNVVRFETTRGRDWIEFVMEPGNRIVKLRWSQDGVERVRVFLDDVSEVKVRKERQGESLVVVTPATDVELWMKPDVRMVWYGQIVYPSF